MAKAKINPLHQLVDDFAKARAAKTAAEKAEAILRKQLLIQFDARGTNRLTGEVYEVTRSESTRDMLDGDAVRALLTPKQIEEVTKTVPVVNLSIVKVDEIVVGRAA